MKILEANNLKHSKVMHDFYENATKIKTFFDYHYKNSFCFSERKKELLARNFQRESIVKQLVSFNQKYHCSNETIENIHKLTNPNSVVVVGGQQAGVLTGPLYTIHKIITVIKLAKEQEEKLRIPVVPVFWIAGEDHDFDEINHIYCVNSGKLLKRKVQQRNDQKQSVSDLDMHQDSVQSFIKEVFRDQPETQNTAQLYDQINEALEKSSNYVDFFSFLIHKLFKSSGIVLLDSHDKQLRELEVPFLKQLISNNEKVNDLFFKNANVVLSEGYGEPIERTENNAHLFYSFRGTRLLLERTTNGLFTDKKGIVSFTESELIDLVEREPHCFSNNVVTRPLMQEYLLPVLAFVAGPGEVTYWATLKEVFHFFNYKVPPIVPRLSMTLIDANLEKWLEHFGLDVQDVIANGTSFARERLSFWDEKEKIDETLHQVLEEVEKIHQPLKELVSVYDKGLEALAHKNELIIKKELTFLTSKIEKSVRQKYQHELLKFDEIEANIYPNGGLQERSLNIVKYTNEYGFDFIEKLLTLPLSINEKHKFIYIK